jgi:Toprim domain
MTYGNCAPISSAPLHFFFDELRQLSGGRNANAPCPACGPTRSTPSNRTRKVLRIWDDGSDFITYACARCGAKGYAHDRNSNSKSPADFQDLRFYGIGIPQPQTQKLSGLDDDQRKKLAEARNIWSVSVTAPSTIVETYLRGRQCWAPDASLRFLPARYWPGPAMVAAFGLPNEPEPGKLTIDVENIVGIHVTKLKPDGSGKAETDRTKIMLGSSAGNPIVLTPINDLGGLVIAEGIEDALSAHRLTNLGAWAAGSASRLPGIAEMVPAHVESVTVMVDSDDAGRRHSEELKKQLLKRGYEVSLIVKSEALP